MSDDANAPQYVAEHVRDALAADPAINELGVHVKIVGRRVVLTGSVATSERQERIGTLVRVMLPDYEVQNEVTVGDVAGATKPETLS